MKNYFTCGVAKGRIYTKQNHFTKLQGFSESVASFLIIFFMKKALYYNKKWAKPPKRARLPRRV